MAARKRKGTSELGWPEQTRAKIQASMLINRLSDHVVGKVEMQPTQVKAAEILLRKVLPDLASIEGNLNVRHSHEDALAQIEESVTLTIEHDENVTYN